jgi:type II secretory pathway component PulF
LAEFSYKGVDNIGGSVNGLIEAVDRRGAIAQLAQRGHFATELFERTASAKAAATETVALSNRVSLFGRGRVKGKDILAITSQLSAALRAGLPILEAIEIIGSQQHKESTKSLLSDLAVSVRSGQSLSEAMEAEGRAFGELYVSMVRVGETGGILDKTMTQLALLLGRDEKVKSNMKNALAYPIFVLAVGLISVIIVLTMILPQIIETIGTSVAMLPLPTRMLMGLSDFLIRFGWIVVLAAGAGVYYFVKWKASLAGRLKLDGFLLEVPVLGGVLKAIAVGRFARTLGALTESGITILSALGVVRGTLGNELLGMQIDKVAGKVKVGRPLAEPLAESGMFPPLLVQIVAIGEQTGKLDELLLNAADTFDEQADAAITRFMAIFPAVLIMLLALIIGFIIAATLLPIMAMEFGGMGI